MDSRGLTGDDWRDIADDRKRFGLENLPSFHCQHLKLQTARTPPLKLFLCVFRHIYWPVASAWHSSHTGYYLIMLLLLLLLLQLLYNISHQPTTPPALSSAQSIDLQGSWQPLVRWPASPLRCIEPRYRMSPCDGDQNGRFDKAVWFVNLTYDHKETMQAGCWTEREGHSTTEHQEFVWGHRGKTPTENVRLNTKDRERLREREREIARTSF